MAVRDVFISDNITISGRTLKFEESSRIEYEFDELNDRFLEGANGPVGFIDEGTPRELARSLRNGYKPKILAEEDVTVEVFAPESTNKIFEKQFTVKYYAQTRENPVPDDAFVTGEGEFELGVPETSDDIFFPIEDSPFGDAVEEIIPPGGGGGGGDCTGSNVIVTLGDSFGDGWQGATFTITDASDNVVFSGELTGSQSEQTFDPIFMNNETHTITVTPDDWPDEVYWTVADENGGILSQCANDGDGCIDDTSPTPAFDYTETFNPCEPIVPAEPPSDITATCIGPNTVQLSWTAPTGSFETYNIYVNGSKAGYQDITGSATQYNVAPISSSTEHDFNISTEDELGQEGALSPTQSFTTTAAEDPYSIVMGVNDYIEFESGIGGLITEAMISQSKISFEVHFKTTNTTDRIMLYQAGYGANSDEGIQIRLNTNSSFSYALNNVICEIRHTGGNYRIMFENEGEVDITDGNWHTIAIRADFTEEAAAQTDNYVMVIDDVRANFPDGGFSNRGVLTNGTMTQFDDAMQADNIRLGISVTGTLGFNGSVFNPMWWREARLAGELTQDRLWYCEDNLTDYKLTEQSGTTIADNDSSVSGSLVGATWNSDRPFNPI